MRKKIMKNGYVLLMLIASIFVYSHAHAQVSKDGGGIWRINTFNGNPKFKYATVVACFNPFDGKYIELPPYGHNDCEPDINQTKQTLKTMMKRILELTKGKYVISIALSVCHPNWYVIYLHTGNEYAEKEVYDKLLEGIKNKIWT